MLTNNIKPPPAVPCNALPATNIFIFVDIAHRIDVAKYIPTAISRIGFRPHMSESFAQMGAEAPLARRYAPPIQAYPEAELRREQIVGRVVATIVVLRAEMKRVS